MIQISMEAARVNKKMSREKAAAALGVSVSALRSWEKGITFPKQPQIERMCEVYGVPYDNIFFGR